MTRIHTTTESSTSAHAKSTLNGWKILLLAIFIVIVLSLAMSFRIVDGAHVRSPIRRASTSTDGDGDGDGDGGGGGGARRSHAIVAHSTNTPTATIRIFSTYEDEVDTIVHRLRAADVLGDPYVLERDIASESQREPHGVGVLLNTLGRAATHTNMDKVIEHYNADAFAYHVYDDENDFELHHDIVKKYAKAWPSLRAVDLERNLPQREYLRMVRRYLRDTRALAAVVDTHALCSKMNRDPHATDYDISAFNHMLPIDGMLFAALCMPNSTFRSAVYSQYGVWRAWQLLRAAEAERGARYEYVLFGREDSYAFKMPPSVDLLRRTDADVWTQKRLYSNHSAYAESNEDFSFDNKGLDDRWHIQRRAVAEVFARAFEWLFHARNAQLAAYMTHYGAERGLLAHTRIVGAQVCKFPGIAAVGCCGGFHCRWNEGDTPIPGTRFRCSTVVRDARFDRRDGELPPIGLKLGEPASQWLQRVYMWFDTEVPQRPRPKCAASAVGFNQCVRGAAAGASGDELRGCGDLRGKRLCRLEDYAWPEKLPCEYASLDALPKSYVRDYYQERGSNITVDTSRYMAFGYGHATPRFHQWPWIVDEFRASAHKLRLVVAKGPNDNEGHGSV